MAVPRTDGGWTPILVITAAKSKIILSASFGIAFKNLQSVRDFKFRPITPVDFHLHTSHGIIDGSWVDIGPLNEFHKAQYSVRDFRIDDLNIVVTIDDNTLEIIASRPAGSDDIALPTYRVSGHLALPIRLEKQCLICESSG